MLAKPRTYRALFHRIICLTALWQNVAKLQGLINNTIIVSSPTAKKWHTAFSQSDSGLLSSSFSNRRRIWLRHKMFLIFVFCDRRNVKNVWWNEQNTIYCTTKYHEVLSKLTASLGVSVIFFSAINSDWHYFNKILLNVSFLFSPSLVTAFKGDIILSYAPFKCHTMYGIERNVQYIRNSQMHNMFLPQVWLSNVLIFLL